MVRCSRITSLIAHNTSNFGLQEWQKNPPSVRFDPQLWILTILDHNQRRTDWMLIVPASGLKATSLRWKLIINSKRDEEKPTHPHTHTHPPTHTHSHNNSKTHLKLYIAWSCATDTICWTHGSWKSVAHSGCHHLTPMTATAAVCLKGKTCIHIFIYINTYIYYIYIVYKIYICINIDTIHLLGLNT